jgi:hypothetical protein
VLGRPGALRLPGGFVVLGTPSSDQLDESPLRLARRLEVALCRVEARVAEQVLHVAERAANGRGFPRRVCKSWNHTATAVGVRGMRGSREFINTWSVSRVCLRVSRNSHLRPLF